MEIISTGTGVQISVIVPVYKVEPYLRTCIDSILNQTFRDFELILIDDGSPDNCGVICDEYAAKDDRIVVIHQENGGVSAARNTGIDWVFANSESQWITFVDSDDLLAPTTLGHLFRHAKTCNADIVTTYPTFFSYESQLAAAPYHVVRFREMTGQEACRHIYLRDEMVSVWAWGKLYKRSLLEIFRFPVGKIHEDAALMPQILHTANTVIVLDAWLYFYRQREGSITKCAFAPNRFDWVEGMDTCIAYFKANQDVEMMELAQNYRNNMCANLVLRAWKNGKFNQIPKPYKMPLVKAIYLTVKDSVDRGGFRLILDRLKRFS